MAVGKHTIRAPPVLRSGFSFRSLFRAAALVEGTKTMQSIFHPQRYLMLWLVVVLFAGWSGRLAAEPPAVGNDNLWYTVDAQGGVRVKLYFFWSQRCPHCIEAQPTIEAMVRDHAWIELHSHEVMGSAESRQLYAELARLFGQDARSVPGFFFCGQMMVGYESAETTGRQIYEVLASCREQLAQARVVPASPQVTVPDGALTLPILGALNLEAWSLPAITVAIAGLDAFNPCAFFVLLFLLSLMVHARNRKRMLLIGGIFVFFSGFIYFLFMAAWLNVFLVVGELRAVTAVAGAIAVAMALLNIKDYVRPGKGPSLSIPESAKPGLYQRMRELLRADSLPAMVVGTVTLAIAVNTYELLCTSGLPMVYTRILTLEQLPTASYYLYLALYNVIYVVPLLLIVLVFTYTLGAHKLQAQEGRILKLLSGLMMLGLGVVLIIEPAWLNNIAVAFGLILGALFISAGIYLAGRRRRPEGHASGAGGQG